MSIYTFLNNHSFQGFGKSATRALLVMAASTSLVPAQTPFIIASASSGQVLDVTGTGVIEQHPIALGTNQQWTLHRVASSIYLPYYEIVSVSDGLVFDVVASSTTPGALILETKADGLTNQAWRLARAPGSSGYEIISANPEVVYGTYVFPEVVNLVLDVPASSTAPGQAIQQYTENDGANQQWQFYPLAARNILASVSGNIISVTGWGFKPGTQACPVFNANLIGACATVQPNGRFSSAVLNAGYYAYTSTAKGFVVVTVEDQSGNVLAIGSLPGQVEPIIN